MTDGKSQEDILLFVLVLAINSCRCGEVNAYKAGEKLASPKQSPALQNAPIYSF